MKILNKYLITYIYRITLLVIVFTSVFFQVKGQEIPPYLRINLEHLSGGNGKKARYKYYVDYSSDSSKLSENFKNSERTYTLLVHSDSEKDYSNRRISNLPPGTILHSRIKKRRQSKTMDIYIRFCYAVSDRQVISIENLSFKKGIFFYDMCSPDNNLLAQCQEWGIFSGPKNPSFKFLPQSNFKISLMKLLSLANQQSCGKR